MSLSWCEFAPAYLALWAFTFANHCAYLGLDSKIQCEYCPALYERKGSLDRHMAKYHPDKIVPDESEVQGETDTTNQECSKCGKSFDDLIVLAEHFNREHDRIDNRYHCPICPKVIY